MAWHVHPAVLRDHDGRLARARAALRASVWDFLRDSSKDEHIFASCACQSRLHRPACRAPKPKFNSTDNSKRKVQLLLFWLQTLGTSFPIPDSLLVRSWKSLASCAYGYWAANGHKKKPQLCINPHHCMPDDFPGLLFSLITALEELEVLEQDPVLRSLLGLPPHWPHSSPTNPLASSRASARSAEWASRGSPETSDGESPSGLYSSESQPPSSRSSVAEMLTASAGTNARAVFERVSAHIRSVRVVSTADDAAAADPALSIQQGDRKRPFDSEDSDGLTTDDTHTETTHAAAASLLSHKLTTGAHGNDGDNPEVRMAAEALLLVACTRHKKPATTTTITTTAPATTTVATSFLSHTSAPVPPTVSLPAPTPITASAPSQVPPMAPMYYFPPAQASHASYLSALMHSQLLAMAAAAAHHPFPFANFPPVSLSTGPTPGMFDFTSHRLSMEGRRASVDSGTAASLGETEARSATAVPQLAPEANAGVSES
eukprot:m.20663 g.20663  ORF g.20663 m.20663 type:complete len:489 (-) comp7901_c1_seq1:44-1510(-)